MPENNQQSASKQYNFCNSQLKTTTDKFIWTIADISNRKQKCGEYLRSNLFTSIAPNGQLLEWAMVIYPNGIDEVCKDYISLILCLLNINDDKVEAKSQISIRKSDGSEDVISPMLYNADGAYHDKLLKREDLFNEQYGYLNGDRLTIVCKLVVEEESDESYSLPDVEVPECRVPEDVLYLFEKSLFPDCKISGDGKEYKVHKCILGCRSPVFGAMFEHEMIEKNNNEVKIEDMKGDVIEEMLRFIYSGKEPANLGEIAEDLLIAADKYELIRLKLLCERKLISTLGNANACGLLTLANLYSAQHLKAHAINFIKIHGNEVMKSAEWKTLANEELKEQILKAIMEK